MLSWHSLMAALEPWKNALSPLPGPRFDSDNAKKRLETLFAVGTFMRTMHWAAGCYVAVTRAAFEAAGGFDERVFVCEELFLSQALKKMGPVVILREQVVTSGRKLRTHSAWDMIRLFGLLLVRGPKLFRSRDQLSFWYGERRHD